MSKKVIKKNGEKTDFSLDKLSTAILKASESVWFTDKSFVENILKKVQNELNTFFSNEHELPVEKIEDITERELMKSWRYNIAKAYIIHWYRKHLKY